MRHYTAAHPHGIDEGPSRVTLFKASTRGAASSIRARSLGQATPITTYGSTAVERMPVKNLTTQFNGRRWTK